MFSVNSLSVHFGGHYLFDEISFLINKSDRIGLVGKNGAGKSTLLKIIAGVEKPDEGSVSLPTGCRIGYLSQDAHFKDGKTVYEEAEQAFSEVLSLQVRIDAINNLLVTSTDYNSEKYLNALNELNELNERFTIAGGYEMSARIEQVLMGLGFERTDLQRQTSEFSGGWRMRVELAKILLQQPDLILLDEPTNHLDIESIQWLEEWMKVYPGAVVLVSHDRTFLDNVTTRTIEISMGRIYDYKGNYSKYKQLREERKQQQLAEKKNQEKYIAHTEDLINKFRAKASKASFAQSLIKKLDKIDMVEVDEDDASSIHFRFPPAIRSGKVVVEAKDVTKRYGEKTIFSNVHLFVERGEKIAFVGKNGEGKSTLSKIIVGEEKSEGELILGHNVKIGYYAQNQTDLLNGDKTVFETIDDVASGDIRKNIRGLLGAFLFSGESVDKKVKVLSGGEKSRLALCRLLLEPYNLLVLDEPTNHLDLKSKDVLKNALAAFDGTLILVSHDRDFLQGLVQKVYEFRKGSVKEFLGGIDEFLQYRKIETLNSLNNVQQRQQNQEPRKKDNPANTRDQQKELKQLKNQLSKVESLIQELEGKIRELDEKLMDPEAYKDAVKNNELLERYDKLKKDLDKQMEKWEELTMQIEEKEK